ncbi:MAG: DNA-directed RNA polymerase [Candidatus Odinarchaeota archaeon]|nr:DNA-directed RNA polymerase [Candidatus Odinarchaeota archaeon]
MFELVTIEDIIRIPPSLFDREIEEAALEVLQQEYEGRTYPEIGKIISVVDIVDVGIGKLIPGDGAAYHPVTFTAVVFRPKIGEIAEGIVVETVDFGVFVRIGPVDGLCHVSQISDDFFSYDSRRGILTGKTTGRTLKAGDIVRARIIAVSLTGSDRSGKFALTMRQPYLGKIEWIKEDIEALHAPKEEEKKEKKEAKAKPTKQKSKSKKAKKGSSKK